MASSQRLTSASIHRVKHIYGAILQSYPTNGEQEMRHLFATSGGPDQWRAHDRVFVDACGLESRFTASQSRATASNSVITRTKQQTVDQSVSEPERRLRELKAEVKTSSTLR